MASTSSFLSRADGMAPSSKGGSYLLLHGDLEGRKGEGDGLMNHSRDAWPVNSEPRLSCLKFRGQVTKRLSGEASRAKVQKSADWLTVVNTSKHLSSTLISFCGKQGYHSLPSGYFEEQRERMPSALATNNSVFLCSLSKWSAGIPRLPEDSSDNTF